MSNTQKIKMTAEQGSQVHDIVRCKLFTSNNLKHVDRNRPPQTKKEKVMEILKVKTSTGIEGIISITSNSIANNVANFQLTINSKKVDVFGIIVLNTNGKSYITLEEKETLAAFGKAIKARLEIVSFADNSPIPAGNTVQINQFCRVRNYCVTIDNIKQEILRTKRVFVEKKNNNLPQDTYSRMMREGFDAIEN